MAGMSDTIPIVRKLQADALNQDVPVSALLRLAKVIATKLDLQDALVWIDRELNGCLDLKADDLPPYRRLSGAPKAWNPYHGWQPIHFGDPEEARLCSQAPVGQALDSIEQSLRERSGGTYTFPYPPEIKARLVKALEFPTEICIHLDAGALWNIVHQVRNLILDWSLELDKAGIVGEDMTFTPKEKREAGPVSQQFIIQNVGVLGDVANQAQVDIQQTAVAALDIAKVRDFIDQARKALPLLPASTRENLEPLLTEAEKSASGKPADQEGLRGLLQSARTICEGAAGNLAAQGIVGLLRDLLV